MMTSPDTLKLLITADLHIGRSLHGRSLLEDQAAMLASLHELARTEQVDGFCIAGDIFDRSVPNTDAVRLASSFFTGLAGEAGIPTLVIAGNHDSPERLDFAAGLLGRQGLHIHGTWTPDPEVLDLEPRDGSFTLRLHPVPYAEPAWVRHALGDEAIETHQDAWTALVKNLEIRRLGAGAAGKPALDILVCHAYIAGGEGSDSERPLSMGASSLVSTDTFTDWDLVLAGHLHRRQSLGGRVFYPGSPLVYSASECGQEKSALLLEVRLAGKEAGNGATQNPGALWSPDVSGRLEWRITPLHLKPRRQVWRLKGLFHDLLSSGLPEGASLEDLYYLELTDQEPVFDAFNRLQSVFPGLLHLERSGAARGESTVTSDRRRQVEAGEEELVQGFIREMGGEAQLASWLPLIQDLFKALRADPTAGEGRIATAEGADSGTVAASARPDTGEETAE